MHHHSFHEYSSRSSSGMRGGGMSRQDSRHNGQHNNNNVVRHRSRSRSTSRSMRRRETYDCGGGQSSLSTHIQHQMDPRRPRRERDPTPLSRAAHSSFSASVPNLNYNGPTSSSPGGGGHGGSSPVYNSPVRRSSAKGSQPQHQQQQQQQQQQLIQRRNTSGNLDGSNRSGSSSEQRAAIAANIAKSSFSAHRNLQKLIDEQREREQMMEYHQQQQQQHPPPHQQSFHSGSSASSVAAVHQVSPVQSVSPLKRLIGEGGNFHKLGTHGSAVSSLSTMSSSPTTLATMNSTSPPPPRDPPQQLQQHRVPSTSSGGGPTRKQQNRSSQELHAQIGYHRGDTYSMPMPRLPDLDEHPVHQPPPQQRHHQQKSRPSDHHHQQQDDKIVSFHRSSTTPCKGRSFHSNSSGTISTAANTSAAGSGSYSSSSYNRSSTISSSSNHHQRSQHSSSSSRPTQYIDKESLHNHLRNTPRESRVMLTRLIDNLQNENSRLHVTNAAHVSQIDKLEAEVGDLLRELLRYRRQAGEGGGGGCDRRVSNNSQPTAADEDISSQYATTAPVDNMSSYLTHRQDHQVMTSPKGVDNMNRQESTNVERQLAAQQERPYGKSKSFVEDGVMDRRRRPSQRSSPSSGGPLHNSITSAPDVTPRGRSGDTTHPTSAPNSSGVGHNISLLRQQLQLTSSPPSRSSSCNNINGGNDASGSDNLRSSFASTASTESETSHRGNEIEYGDDSHTIDESLLTADESMFDSSVSAQQRSFKEDKKTDSHATSRWATGRFTEVKEGDGDRNGNDDHEDHQSATDDEDENNSLHENEARLIQQQQEHSTNNQDGEDRQGMIRSNSLEDICAPQKQRRRSNFVERKDGSTTGSMSLTDDTVSSWSCSTPGSGGK